jgi:hypothetical protein
MSDLASATVIEFSLRLFADRLLIEVIDSSPDHPVLNPPDDASAEHGRGLTIVEDLSSEWGYFLHQGRKVVYCILPITRDADCASKAPPFTAIIAPCRAPQHCSMVARNDYFASCNAWCCASSL